MPRHITIGSGLTQRQSVLHTPEEADASDALREAWYPENQFPALITKAKAILDAEGLPSCSCLHAIYWDKSWRCLKANENAKDDLDAVEFLLGPWDGGHPIDSPPYIAARVLVLIPQILQRKEKLFAGRVKDIGYEVRRLVQQAQLLGDFAQLLFWKQPNDNLESHEEAAIAGHKLLENRRDGRAQSAASQKQGAQRRRDLIRTTLKQHLSESQIAKYGNSELANIFLNNCFPKIKCDWHQTSGSRNAKPSQTGMTRQIRMLRKANLLPPKA